VENVVGRSGEMSDCSTAENTTEEILRFVNRFMNRRWGKTGYVKSRREKINKNGKEFITVARQRKQRGR
jgi:hypothetical protein